MAPKHQRIKILFSIPNFDTAGSGKAVLKLAMGLNAVKFEPHIMCLHDRGTFFKEVEKSGIPVHIIPYTTPIKPYIKGGWNCYKISRLLKSIQPDIIHSFHYAADYSEPLAAKMAGIPWVYTKKNMNWGGASKNSWKVRSFLAAHIVLQNTEMKSEFFKHSKKTTLIPRGVDTDEFKPFPQEVALKNKWDIDENEKIIMCVANFVPVKGTEYLIKAFGSLCKKKEGWKLLLVGDNTTEYGKKLQLLVRELDLLEKVVFTNKQRNICSYLNLAAVFVLPTLNSGRREGSPVALLEAMACEKYVIASKTAGINDQLSEFQNHLFEAGNVSALEEKLLEACNLGEEERSTIGKKFRKHVLSKYRLEHEVVKTEELYLKISNKN